MIPCTKVNTLSQTCRLLSKAAKSSFRITLIRANAAKFEYSNGIFLKRQRRGPHRDGTHLCWCSLRLRRAAALIMHDADRDTDRGRQGDPAVTVDWRGRDEATLRPSLPPAHPLKKPPPHPSLSSPGRGSGRKSTPNQRHELAGKVGVRRARAVPSPLYISAGDLRTGSASLYLHVVIKYCLSAQLLPEAKGKSRR